MRELTRRFRRWATSNQTEGTVRRRPTDALRVVLAIAVLVPLAFHAGHPPPPKRPSSASSTPSRTAHAPSS